MLFRLIMGHAIGHYYSTLLLSIIPNEAIRRTYVLHTQSTFLVSKWDKLSVAKGSSCTTIPGRLLITQPCGEPSHAANKRQRITSFPFKVWGQREREWDKTEDMTHKSGKNFS